MIRYFISQLAAEWWAADLLSPEDWGLTVTWWPGLAWSPHCPTETERDGRWRLSSLSSLTVRLGATTRGRWTSGCFFSTKLGPASQLGKYGSGEWDLWSAIKFHWVDTVSTISFRGVKGKIIDNLLICFFNYVNINYHFIICKWRRDPTPSLEKYHWEGLTLF